jgi:hypothetical protein
MDLLERLKRFGWRRNVSGRFEGSVIYYWEGSATRNQMPTLLVDCPYTHRRIFDRRRDERKKPARFMEGKDRSELSPLS